MGDEERSNDELPRPPFRPWSSSGVEHPGASRPHEAPVPDQADPSGTTALSGSASEPRDPQPLGLAPGARGRFPAPRAAASPPAMPLGYGQPVRVEYIVQTQPSGVNGLGLASLVLGILSFLIPWLGLLSLLAVVFGLFGRSPTRYGNNRSGDGFAVAGIILGLTSFILYLILFRGLFLLLLLR